MSVSAVFIVSSGLIQPERRGTDTDLMFYIQRNVDDRQVHYVLNREANGQLDADDPFNVFWMSASGNGSPRRLNVIQRRFVYGVRVQSAQAGRIEFRIAAYPELPLFLQSKNGEFRVYTDIDGIWCVLKRIHVQLEDDNVINPNVTYVRLEGVDEEGRLRVGQIYR